MGLNHLDIQSKHTFILSIEEKLKSFVCDVEVVNGHNEKITMLFI